MQRERRLTSEADFARVFAAGRGWSGPLLVLRAARNEGEVSRFGFSVSKKLGKAVLRNRIRRRLRGIARATSLRPGWDVVVIARAPAATASFAALAAALVQLLNRAHLLEAERPR